MKRNCPTITKTGEYSIEYLFAINKPTFDLKEGDIILETHGNKAMKILRPSTPKVKTEVK